MLTDNEYAVIAEGLRTLFLIALPISLGVGIAGTLVGTLQSATTIQDHSLSYVVRLIALVGLLYIFGPMAVEALASLMELALQ